MKINHRRILLVAALCVAGLLIWREMQRPPPGPIPAAITIATGPAVPTIESIPAFPVNGKSEVEIRKPVAVGELRIDNYTGAGLVEWGLLNSNARSNVLQFHAPQGGESVGAQSRRIKNLAPVEFHLNAPGQQYPVDIGLEDAVGGGYPAGVGTLGQPSRHLLDMRGNSGIGTSAFGK